MGDTNNIKPFHAADNRQCDFDTVTFLIVGDHGVDGSAVWKRFPKIKASHHRAKSASGVLHTFRVVDYCKKTILVKIWDYAGSGKRQTVAPFYYRKANGIIIMHGYGNKKPLDSVKNWLKEVKRYASPNVYKILVGNKCLFNRLQMPNYKAVKKYADQLEIPVKVAAMDDCGKVEQVFLRILSDVRRNMLNFAEKVQRGKKEQKKIQPKKKLQNRKRHYTCQALLDDHDPVKEFLEEMNQPKDDHDTLEEFLEEMNDLKDDRDMLEEFLEEMDDLKDDRDTLEEFLEEMDDLKDDRDTLEEFLEEMDDLKDDCDTLEEFLEEMNDLKDDRDTLEEFLEEMDDLKDDRDTLEEFLEEMNDLTDDYNAFEKCLEKINQPKVDNDPLVEFLEEMNELEDD